METIQDLIGKLGETPSPEALAQIEKQFLSQETIWAAYFPRTRNFYLHQENGQSTAYVFSEKQYYDQFEDFMKKQGIEVVCSSNPKEYRSVMLADMYRSGFTMLILDNNFHPHAMLLENLMGDDKQAFEQKQLVLNRDLVAKINFCFQKIAAEKATSNTGLEMFQAVYDAKYLLPVDVSGMKNVETNPETGEIRYSGGGKLEIPALQAKDGKHFFPLFTDIFEIQRYDKEHKFSAQIIRFTEAKKLIERVDGIVVNPMGANLRLDKELVQSIVDNAGKPLPPKAERRMSGSKSTGIYFETPDVDAVENMLDILCDALPEISAVNAVYIRQARRSGETRPYYLFVVDAEGEQSEIYKKIAELAIPQAQGFNLEFTNFDGEFGKQAVGICKPFYRKEN